MAFNIGATDRKEKAEQGACSPSGCGLKQSGGVSATIPRPGREYHGSDGIDRTLKSKREVARAGHRQNVTADGTKDS